MRTTVKLVAAVLALAPLTGCVGFGGDESEDQGNTPPVAALLVEPSQAWTGERLEFDASDSSDPDGAIEEYRFDFGDGNTTTVRASDLDDDDDESDADEGDDAKVDYAYTRGGRYTALLTVRDDGSGSGVKKTDTTTTEVVINERKDVAGVVVKAPVVNESDTSEYTMPFRTSLGVDSFALNLTVQARGVVGASEILVQVVDEAGDVVQSETVSLSSGEGKDVDLEGDLDDEEQYRVVVSAEDGAAEFRGVLEVYYSESAAEDTIDG